jgi:hypothetical protein
MDFRSAMDITRRLLPNGKPRAFDITFVTCDRNRKRGGEVIELKDAIRVRPPGYQEELGKITVSTLHNDHHPTSIDPYLILFINGEQVT